MTYSLNCGSSVCPFAGNFWVCWWKEIMPHVISKSEFKLCLAGREKVKAMCVVAGGDIKTFCCCKSRGEREEIKAVVGLGKCRWAIKVCLICWLQLCLENSPDPSYGSGCCVRPHVPPFAKQASAIHNPSPLPSTSPHPLHWKGWPLNSQASGNICSPEIHTSCQLGLGWASGTWGRTPWCSCGPEKDQTRKFCGWVEGGALLAGGCLAVAAPLCLKGGRDRICS